MLRKVSGESYNVTIDYCDSRELTQSLLLGVYTQ